MAASDRGAGPDDHECVAAERRRDTAKFYGCGRGAAGHSSRRGTASWDLRQDGDGRDGCQQANPARTDSWFVGFRGTVAFAVEFDQAGFGAQVAAPTAARFLRALGPT